MDHTASALQVETGAGRTRAATPHLSRALGLLATTLFIVTAGSSLQWTAPAAAAGPSSLLVWLIGALVMLVPLSVCVAFLSARYPEEGGLYVWSKRAFGPYAGFMTGWTYWTSNLPYLPVVLYFIAGGVLFWGGDGKAAVGASPAYFVVFSLAVLLVSALLNVRGIRRASLLNGAGALARWIGTLLLIGLALATWWRFGPATTFDRQSLMPHPRLADVLFWSTIVFSSIGPEAISLMAGEIRDPRHTIPRALALAAPLNLGIYVFGTASLLIAVPASRTSELYGVVDAMSSAAARLGLAWLIPVGVACVVFDRLGSACLWLGAAARLPFVAGIDHYLPPSFARIHPHYGSPSVAIWTQALFTAVFVVLGQAGTSVSGGYRVLVDMMVAVSLLPFVPLFGSAIALSGAARERGEARIPGGRLTVVAMGSLGLATTVTGIALAFVPAPGEEHPRTAVLKVVGVTVARLLIGSALYLKGRARARRLRPPC